MDKTVESSLSPPHCKDCGGASVKPIVLKPEVIFWWCATCAKIWGESRAR